MELDQVIRGAFIAETIELESLISEAIAIHFCPEPEQKRNEFLSLIVYRRGMTFSDKLSILEVLLKTHYEDILKKDASIIKDVKEIMEFRNKLGHCKLDDSDEFLDMRLPNTIRLIHYSNGERKYLIINKDEASNMLKKQHDLFARLLLIRRMIIKKTGARIS